MKRQAWCTLVAVALSVFVWGVVEAGTVIRIASSFDPKHTTCQAGDYFKKLVEERSQGAIQVQTFWGAVMGSEEELTESVSTGGVEMQVGGGIPIKIFAPQYQFMNDPFIMRDWNHWKKVWDAKVGKDLKDMVERKGRTRYVEVMYLGVRQFTSNKPILTPKDVQGLKLRLPNLPTWVKVWKELGALPVPIALNELFTSLQSGVADASEGMVSQIQSFRLNEVQKYLSLTGHGIQSGAFTIGRDFFNKLDTKSQDLVMQAGKDAAEWATKSTVDGESAVIADLEKKGMKIVKADQKAFFDKAKPAVDKLFETDYPVTTWKEILSY
jgi:tripartite ATP-independent transporter DctP family solute receptor